MSPSTISITFNFIPLSPCTYPCWYPFFHYHHMSTSPSHIPIILNPFNRSTSLRILLLAHLHQPPWRQHLLNVIGSPPRLPSSPRRHCSSFPCAATALLFIVQPVETSRVERQMVKRWAVLPMMVLGLGFELGTQAQAYEEKPTFMKALIALGLPIDILWAWA